MVFNGLIKKKTSQKASTTYRIESIVTIYAF